METQTTDKKITQDVLDRERKTVGTMDLDPAVFGSPVKEHLLHQMVVYQQAKHRSGTAHAKTRGEVNSSGRKPWRQKGTGRARAGARSSPLWTGGGVIFGPSYRDFSIKLPKKVRKAALKSALSAKRKDQRLLVVDELDLDEIKTRDLVEWIKDLELDGRKVLIVIPEKDEKVELSARNLQRVKVLRAGGLNVRDILFYEWLVMTRGAVEKIQEALA